MSAILTEDCMRGQKSILACVVFLFVFFTGTAVAQPHQCSHVEGSPWIDKYGYTWSLTQSGGSVSGSVDTNYCGTWDVSGTMSDGHFSLTATNYQYPGPNPYCGESFEYIGDLEVGGCNVGEGSWLNPEGGDSFWWDKACEIPSGETTHPTQLGWVGPDYLFRAEILDTSGGDLSGRFIREVDFAAGEDSCWFEGSEVEYWDGVVAPPPLTLSASNAYADRVGWGTFPVNYYRAAGRAPCGVVLSQQVQLACDSRDAFGVITRSWAGFKNNYLAGSIGPSPNNQVGALRDVVAHYTIWP
jgi:hypothetical protein